MTIVADTYRHVIGVDTHAATHTYVVLDAATAAITAGPSKFPTSPAGLERAVAWCQRRAPEGLVLVAVEGTGSYGHLLTEALQGASIPVTEVRPPRRGGPKSDALDATQIGRSVLGVPCEQLVQPRTGDIRQQLQILTTARHALSKQAVADTERLVALLRRIDLGVDARHSVGITTITRISRWHQRRTDQPVHQVARAEAVRLAQAIVATGQQLRINEKSLAQVVASYAPGLLDLVGVGPISAAHILVSWSHHGRFATESRFAMHAGVAPIPTGSGKTDGRRVRLNRGNDRQLNSAIYHVARTRMRCSERTRAYVAKRTKDGLTPDMIARLVRRYCLRDIYRYLDKLDLNG